MLETVFNKVAGLQADQHRCFPVKIAKILEIQNLNNIYERLIQIFICRFSHIYQRNPNLQKMSNATDKERGILKYFLLTYEAETSSKSHQFLILSGFLWYYSEAHSKPSQISKMEFLSKIINC